MKILFQSATIFDRSSAHHLQQRDVLVDENIIVKIGDKIATDQVDQVITSNHLCISQGWMDMNATVEEPGHEYRETYQSISKAAAAGGFTHLGLMPNTQPTVQNSAMIEMIAKNSALSACVFIPYGAMTNQCEGKELAELYDMHFAGAKAFTDGNSATYSTNVLKRAMLYVKAFDGLIILDPYDQSLADGGLMHEGITSVKLGMKGIPAIAEELGVVKAIYLSQYTNSRIHLINISSAGSVELIREAKAKGVQITCSCNAYNLILNDEKLIDYDSNLKVLPPLRSNADIAALVKGVIDGTIDTICSAHTPIDEEGKNLEFDLASNGMIGLQTVFPILSEVSNSKTLAHFIDAISNRPRAILSQALPTIAEGSKACITAFDPGKQFTFTPTVNFSKSKNTPFFNQSFKGSVIGTFFNHQNKSL